MDMKVTYAILIHMIGWGYSREYALGWWTATSSVGTSNLDINSLILLAPTAQDCSPCERGKVFCSEVIGLVIDETTCEWKKKCASANELPVGLQWRCPTGGTVSVAQGVCIVELLCCGLSY